MNLNESQSEKLDRILAAFEGGEYLVIDKVESIEPVETKANGLINILSDRGLIKRMADTEDNVLPRMLYLKSKALLFLENGGFRAEYHRQEQREQNAASSNVHIYATGDGNLINAGHHNSIHATFNNTKGALSELQAALKKYNVTDADIQEITNIVRVEVPQQQSLGVKANNWIMKMLAKSLDGTWEVGIAVAGGVLAEIINKFYGL